MRKPDVNAPTWEEFLARLEEIRQAEGTPLGTDRYLFRGLADSTWRLSTTLERAGFSGKNVGDYCSVIMRVKPQVESFTGLKWEIGDLPSKIHEVLGDYDSWTLRRFPDPVFYSYMIHLRHHGFPSPLLDWTRSPFVAAYFAFRSREIPAKGRVSICMFADAPKGYKTTSNIEPHIRRIGPYVTTHRRHFLQQSDYTMCVMFPGKFPGQLQFMEHEEVLGFKDPHQDLLWRFNIPWTERPKVLRLLDEYNLNAFSLFDSEESLMETLSIRELESSLIVQPTTEESRA